MYVDARADVGESALFVVATPLASEGGQTSAIRCSSSQQVLAPPGWDAAATAAVADRRTW